MTTMIHHVQLACPPGSEDVARDFYVGLLGLSELPKPPALAGRGGCWFAGHGIELHLGVEEGFRPARKAHPGLLWPELDRLAERLAGAGYPVIWPRTSCRGSADSIPRTVTATGWSSWRPAEVSLGAGGTC